jgi:hypothetical protein
VTTGLPVAAAGWVDDADGSGVAVVAESDPDECLVAADSAVTVGSGVAVSVGFSMTVSVGVAGAVSAGVGVALLGAPASVVGSVEVASALSVLVLAVDVPDAPEVVVVAVFSDPPAVPVDALSSDADFASFAAAVAPADDADDALDEEEECVDAPADEEPPESDPPEADEAPEDDPDDALDEEEPPSSANAMLSCGPASETPNSATPTPAEAAPVCSQRRTPKLPDRRPGRRCRPLATVMFITPPSIWLGSRYTSAAKSAANWVRATPNG